MQISSEVDGYANYRNEIENLRILLSICNLIFCRSRYKQGPWIISLQPHVYGSFLEHCPSTDLRRNTYRAYKMRASNHMSQDISNSIHIEEIRSLR